MSSASQSLTPALCLAMLCAPRMASVDAQQARPNQQNNGNGNQNQGNGNQGNGNQGNGNQGNGNQGNGKNDQDEDNDVESKIDADIQGPERSVIHNAMRGLRRQDRENVMLLGADGQIYANKTWLKDACEVPQKIDDNLYQGRDGRQFTLPAPTPKPTENMTPDGNALPQANAVPMEETPFQTSRPNAFGGQTKAGTGPYRRVYSKLPPTDASPGYSYEDGSVNLPGQSLPVRASTTDPKVYENPRATDDGTGNVIYRKDSANIYMGGWSAGFTSSNGTPYDPLEADAGFEHDNGVNLTNPDPALYPTPYRKDTWMMFIAAVKGKPAPKGVSQDGQPFVDHMVRILPNQKILMKFYVTYDAATGKTYLNLSVKGYAKNVVTGAALGNHSWAMITDVTLYDAAGNNPYSPWHQDGTGVVLKRMVSMAQNPGQNFRTCSYIKKVLWENCMICITGGTPALWDQNSFGGQEDYPPLVNNKGPVYHDSFSYSGERDTITLCGNRPR